MKTLTWSRTRTALTTADLDEFDIMVMEYLVENKLNPIVSIYILTKDRDIGMTEFKVGKRAITLRQILAEECSDTRQVAVNAIDKMIAGK